ETNSTVQIPAPNRFASGPDATLHVRLTSSNYGDHDFVISLNDQNLDTVALNDLRMADLNYTIPVSLLTDDNQLKVTSLNTTSRQSLVIIELIYPRSLAAETTASSFIIDGKPNAQHFLISGMFPQSIPPVIYTADGLRRMVTSLDASDNVEFVWPQTLDDQRLVFLNLNGGLEYITTFEQKSFVDFSGDDTEYVVITHPDLMEIGTGSEYIQYRASVAGGSYNAKAYSILDLYDQFGYGIEKHPQAIRNFVEFMHRNWPSAKMIFIVGRAIEYNRSRYNDGSWEEGFFVPTVGRPGSDGLLAATTWDLVPRYPIGRLAIVDQEGVDIYLDKIKEHDLSRFAGQTLEDKLWIKNVMHLGGGKSAIEQNDFKAVLGDLGEELAASGYGAKIHFFQKKSTEIIGESQSAQILKLLNDGCGLINYLGHSASTTFEFNINDASEWNNQGRYPVFSAMGCSAGQIHGTIFSLSDAYVQIPNEGAIAFISGSGSQFASALISWARPWYDYMGNFGYGGTLGESILHGLRSVSNFVNPELTGSNQYRYLLEQQTFQGDPAIRMHPFDGPDYLIDRSSVSITPGILTTKTDSFDVTFNVANIGRNLNQNVTYRIFIKTQDGQETQVIDGNFLADRFETNITVKLPLATAGKPGAFRLLIRIDPDQSVEEAPAPDAENNNDLVDNLGVEGIQFLVVDNVVSAAYPPDFNIITTAIPELVATSSNAFIRHQSMVMQVDTTALFNSP
ncbi:MAG: C25 family cysteine peptidase, partial [Saprospiraceae bacterium]